MSTLPILYSFRRCPYAIRARLAIKASGVPVALREIVLRDKPAHMLAISPKGTVPVLLLPDGQVIDQSLDIMRWALMQHDPQGWLRHTHIGEHDVGAVHAPALGAAHPTEVMNASNQLIALNNRTFKALLDAYKYPERHPQRSAAATRALALEQCLHRLEARLQQHANLLGDQPALADMAWLPFIRQFAQVDAGWFAREASLPALRAWLTRHLASALFESVMIKYPLWQPGHPDIPL